MIRSKCAVELCALIVDDVYGELASRIFATLLRRGRLTVPMLVNQTRLTPKHIHHGLAVLVRQGLAYYCEEPSGATFYESNLDGAYSLIRIGKILDTIDSRHGQVAKVFAEIVLSLGHPTIADIAAEYEKREQERVDRELAHIEDTDEGDEPHVDVEDRMDEGMDGQHVSNGQPHGISNGASSPQHDTASKHVSVVGDWHTSGKMDEALWDLLEARLIEPVTDNMFTSMDDIYKQHEKILINRDYGGSITGLKAKAELKDQMRSRLRDLRDQGRDPPKRRNKRPMNGNHVNGDFKRRKSGHGAKITDDQNDVEQVDRSLVVRLNQERCLVALRSRKLSDLAARDIGKTTGKIYGELLRLVEPRIPRCRPDPRMDDEDEGGDSFSITTMELDGHMDKSIVVSKGIGKYNTDDLSTSNGTNGTNTTPAAQKRSYDKIHSDDDDEYIDHSTNGTADPFEEDLNVKPTSKVSFHQSVMQSEDRSTRLIELNKHLALLSDHRHQFLTKCGNNERGEWTIDFKRLSDYMIHTELDTMVYREFGSQGRRLYQILREKGKLDESTLEKRALFTKKDMQQKLTEMQRSGFVDIQEVPRDNTRLTARTMFLWYVDHQRINSIVLDTIYKAISRCMEVIDVEKSTYRDVLATTERTDVAGYEEEMLDPRSLEQYHQWQEKQEKILTQISRLDDLVGIFRDF